jgi:hypothetical protein
MSSSNTRSGGMGFCSVLTLIFIVLKLTNTITWSWIWVLSPIWIPIVLVVFLVVIAALLSEV